MAAAHHATHRPQYQLPPPPGYNDDLRLPSIKDLAFAYERPRQDPPPPPPTHTSQPLPEYAPSSQERVHHPQSSWKRPAPHAAPPPAMPAHHHQHLPQQHNPPLSAGHEVPSRPDEYPPPKHHDNGGYITPGGPAMGHLPGSGAPVRNDDHAHLHPNKRARTSQTPIASSRDTRPQQSPYPPPYQHQPQYQVAPPPPSPYPPVSSAPPTNHQAPPPPSPHPMHHPHHHQQSPPHGYSQYGQQYIPGRPVHLPPHHTTHHVQPQHTPQHTPVAAPLPPPPSGVQSQLPPNPQPVSYSSSAPPTVPPTAPPDWEHHQSHQPHPVHHIHHQPPPPPPPPSHAPVQHGQPPQHYSHLPPPPLPQQPIPANVPAPASAPSAPPPPQVYSHPPPPPSQHSQTYTRSSIAPSEIEHRPTSTSYPPAGPEKNPAREKTMTEIVHLCAILYDFASRYAQLTASLPYAQPSSTEIAEMANKANEVVRLLEELRRMNMPEAERVKQPEVSAVPVAAATTPPSPDDHRPPKRPWEDMSQDGQAPTQTESSVVFAEPYTAPAPAPTPAAEPAPTPQSTAEQDMELIRTKRATTAAGAAAAAGQPKTKYRKRSRATPPGKCHSCNIKETPEWRRGPDGARTLCNACGLHYAKLMRKQSKMNPGPNGEPPPPIDMDMLRASTRAAEAEKSSRQKEDSDRHASPATNSAPATPLTGQHHHQGSFQILSVQPEQGTSATSTSSSSEARTTHLSLGQPPPPPWTSRSFSNAASEQLQHQSFLRSSHVPETSPR